MKNIESFRYDVGSRLKEFLKQNNITQLDFSEKLGIANTTLSSVIRGKNGISSDVAYSIILNYPDLSWEWLFKNQGDMTLSNVVVGEQNHIANMVIHPQEDKELREELAALRERVKGLEEQIKLKDQIIELLKNK